MHADVNMDPYEGEDERTHKKRKHSNGNPLCHPQLNGRYTMHALENLLGEDTAKSAASTTPKRFAGRGHGKPNIEQFLITDGEDTFKQFYVLGHQTRFEIVD